MDKQSSYEAVQYDIALSFAGEDRTYVAQVAHLLQERGIRVFYDEFAIAETWGADLYTFLDEVYRKKSRFAAVFISQHYAAKPWTTHERQSVQARTLSELGSYLLPVRLDDSELPGLRPTVGYVDARRISVEQLVDLMAEKLGAAPGETLPIPQFTRVPRTAEETRQLLAQRPFPWEHLLFAGVLVQRRDAIEHKWRDYEINYARKLGGYLSLKEAGAMLIGAGNEVAGIIEGMVDMLAPSAQQAAFGAPDEPGDPDRIEHLASRFISRYEELLDWAAQLRSMSVPEELNRVFELTIKLADKPLRTIRLFIGDLAAEMDTVTERLDKDEDVQVNMGLILEVDEHVSAELSREIKQVLERLE